MQCVFHGIDGLIINSSAYNIGYTVLFYFTLKILLVKISYEKSFNYVCWILLISLFIEIIIISLQIFNIILNTNVLFQIAGSSGHPGFTAGVMSLSILILGSNIDSLNKTRKILFYIAFGFVLVFSLATLSRASILIMLLAIFSLLKPQLMLIEKKYRNILAYLLISISVLFLSYLGFVKIDSLDGRTFIWKRNMELIAEKPIFGYGTGSFVNIYNGYQMNYFRDGNGTEGEQLRADYVMLSYNDFIEISLENGIIGLMLLLFILIVVLRNGMKKNTNISVTYPVLGFIVFMSFWGVIQEVPYSSLLFTVIAFAHKNDREV